MELLREEVNTEIAVLASLRRGSDTDDLAGSALEDQEIANADVVAGDGDGIGNHSAGGVVADAFSDLTMRSNFDVTFLDDYFLAVDFVVVMVTTAVNGVENTVSSTLDTTANAVVMSVVVVIAHIRSSLAVDCLPSSLFYSDLFAWKARRVNSGPSLVYSANFGARVVTVMTDFFVAMTVARRVYGRARGPLDINLCGLPDVLSRASEARIGVSLFEPAVVLSNQRPCGFAVAPFSLVKDSLRVVRTGTANRASFAVVETLLGESLVLDVDLGVDVPLIWLTVAGREWLAQSIAQQM